MGDTARESRCPGATSASAWLGAGGKVPVWPWVLPQAGHQPCAPLPFPTLCSGRMGEPVLSSFPSSATDLFPRVSQSPPGQTLSPGSPRCLSPFPTPWVLGAGASPHTGHPTQPGHAPASPDVPQGCTAGGGGGEGPSSPAWRAGSAAALFPSAVGGEQFHICRNQPKSTLGSILA